MFAIAPTLVAALASSTPAPLEVADVEVVSTAETSTLTAYDADGEVIGEVVAWQDAERSHVDIVLPSGAFLGVVVADGRAIVVDQQEWHEVSAFMVALHSAPQPKLTETRAIKCAGALLLMAGGCGTTPIGCAVGALAVHFECIAYDDGEDDEESEDETETGE